MKVCQRWCKLDRGPLQAHCAWKCPLASWNMQLLWLDSVPAGFQSLHKHSPTMFSWKLTICGACPTVRHPPNCPWEGRLTLQFGPQIKGLESFCWGIRGLCSALNCVARSTRSFEDWWSPFFLPCASFLIDLVPAGYAGRWWRFPKEFSIKEKCVTCILHINI